ncbi:MAG: F0F1 ATP synthase subunit gamma [Clostridia bacterium]|nr:F0F1 ATP synthase subunit gamma [Clostridia bacterium]
MPAIQSLKKQLKGILSTKKLTKAMKTVSTVKFSKLNGVYSEYSHYGKAVEDILNSFGADFLSIAEANDSSAPAAVIVIASNKGLCGNFNAELLNFALEEIEKIGSSYIIACGKKAISFLKNKKIPVKKEYVFDDVPLYDDAASLLEELLKLRKSGEISRVYVVYSKYKNMMLQTPTLVDFFNVSSSENETAALFIPDKQTVMHKIVKNAFKAKFYELVLESAIGAQAATLMTMRSAYDTATEYAESLEKEINRVRQSAVTADVITTSAERDEKGGNKNG